MSAGKSLGYGAKDKFVKVRKRDLEKLTTEVMQLKDFLPRVLNRGLTEMLQKARITQTMQEHLAQEHQQFRQERQHLQSRLDMAQTECQKEKEEKFLLRDQLWESSEQLQEHADFCFTLGSATCSLLWSCSASDDTVARWLADGKLQSFLTVASQTLESFVQSQDAGGKSQTEDPNSEKHQFVLALTGTITNIAAVPCGRNFLSGPAHNLLDTLMRLLEQMKPGVFPKLKVLMLMCLYNLSISVTGFKNISENPRLMPLIQTLLNDGDWEVCLHSLRLLQSVLLDDVAPRLLGPALLDPDLRARVGQLKSSAKPSLRAAALQTLEDLHALQQERDSSTQSLTLDH